MCKHLQLHVTVATVDGEVTRGKSFTVEDKLDNPNYLDHLHVSLGDLHGLV